MSKISITYDCPLRNQLSKNKKGQYDCSKCKRIVHDFTKLNQKELAQKTPKICSQSLCGIYRLDQVHHNSNLNWKTRLSFTLQQNKNSNRFILLTMLLSFVVFVLSCNTRVVAGMSTEGWNYNNYKDSTHPQNTNFKNFDENN